MEGANFPAGQFIHDSTVVAPSVGSEDPAGHAAQAAPFF